MVRAGFVAALAALALVQPATAGPANRDEERIVGVLEAAFNAEEVADFARLASLVHPRTQHLFRDLLSARTDVLLRSHSQEQISAVSGLPAHPKDLPLSDAEFFVFTCNSTKARHPDFAMDWTHRPFTLEATTFDPDQRAHVVLTSPRWIQTERTNFGFVSSMHLFFRQEQTEWLLWSCPFADGIGKQWARDLAQLNVQPIEKR